MSGSERLDSKAGPLGNLSQAYFGTLDTIAKGYEPALKGVGRWNLELMGLMTKRSREWLEMPTRLTRCKSPVDLVNEQMRFVAGKAPTQPTTTIAVLAALNTAELLKSEQERSARDSADLVRRINSISASIRELIDFDSGDSPDVSRQSPVP